MQTLKTLFPFTAQLIILMSLFLTLYCAPSQAQTILLERETKKDTVQSQIGKNKKHYGSVIFGLGFIVGPTQDIEIKYGASYEGYAGVMYRRKLSRKFFVGADLSYRWQKLRLNSEIGNIKYTNSLTDSLTTLNSVSLLIPSIDLGVFLKIRFSKGQGNTLGTYMDLGAGVGVPIGADYTVNYKENRPPNNQVSVSRSNLGYIQPIQTYATVRLGYSRIAVYGRFRLTELFKEQTMQDRLNQKFKLPAGAVGLQIAF